MATDTMSNAMPVDPLAPVHRDRSSAAVEWGIQVRIWGRTPVPNLLWEDSQTGENVNRPEVNGIGHHGHSHSLLPSRPHRNRFILAMSILGWVLRQCQNPPHRAHRTAVLGRWRAGLWFGTTRNPNPEK